MSGPFHHQLYPSAPTRFAIDTSRPGPGLGPFQTDPRAQYMTLPPSPKVFTTNFVCTPDNPQGEIRRIELPEHVSISAPRPMGKPKDPSITQRSLLNMILTILYIQYACDEGCRNFGCCVHYLFVLPKGKYPDGLICDACNNPWTIRKVHPVRYWSPTRSC